VVFGVKDVFNETLMMTFIEVSGVVHIKQLLYVPETYWRIPIVLMWT